MGGIVERLRAHRASAYACQDCYGDTMDEAADVIAKMQEALKPFVAWGSVYPRPRINVSPEDTIIVSASDVHITLADLDRACAAIAIAEGR